VKGRVLCALIFVSAALTACNRRGNATEQPLADKTPSNIVIAKAATRESFDHAQPDHARTPCQSCHQRKDAEGLSPGRPYHDACIQCHAKEDYLNPAQSAPFCKSCHPSEGILDAASATHVKVFPAALRQFGVAPFSHGVHRDRSCQSCHGDVDTEPAAVPAHKECYSCHVHSPGQKLGRCEDCHSHSDASMQFMREPGAAARDDNFRHAAHRKKKDGSLITCGECHQIIPAELASMKSDISLIAVRPGEKHKSQCWGTCHVQKEEPVCGKCHVQGAPRAGSSG
jgi:hypothetical protein